RIVYSPGTGHHSFHPCGLPVIVTDAYPGEEVVAGNEAPTRHINAEPGKEVVNDSVFETRFINNLHIDAHPAWDRSGRYVVYNGTENGTRTVFVADLKKLISEQYPRFKFKPEYD